MVLSTSHHYSFLASATLENRDCILLIFVSLMFSPGLGDGRYLISVLVSLGYHNKNTIDWVLKQYKSFTVGKLKIKLPARSVSF